MNEVRPNTCICGIDIFLHNDVEHVSPYEDLRGTIPHTKLRCEINQIVSTKLNRVEIELNKIKERLNC